MAIVLKTTASAVESTYDLKDIDVSFIDVITSTMIIPVRHRFFGNREIGTIMMSGDNTSIFRNGTENVIRPIMFFDCKNPDEHTPPALVIGVCTELWPRRVFVKCCDCNMCQAGGISTCLPCPCKSNDGQDCTFYDVHKTCVTDSLRDTVKSILLTIEEVYNDYVNKKVDAKIEQLLTDIFGDTFILPELEKTVKPVVEPVKLPDGWHVEDVGDKCVLHFTYKNNSRKRSIKKHTVSECENILAELKVLLDGGISDNSTAKRYYKELCREDYKREMEQHTISYCSELEAKLKDRDKEIEELKQQLYKNQQQLASLSNVSKACSGDINLVCEERELFPNEINYQLLDSLRAYYESNYKDIDRMSRRADILKHVLECNPVHDVEREIKEGLYSAYYSKDIHRSSVRNDIRQLGFDCVDNGEGHVLIYPTGHPELSHSLASTPSDYRTRDNEISAVLRKLFK